MDLIQQYVSDSDNGETQSDSEREAEAAEAADTEDFDDQPSNFSLPPPPRILIYSQQYQNMLSKPRALLFTFIPWMPSLVVLRKLELIVEQVISQVPALSENYNFVVPNKDLGRYQRHHITIALINQEQQQEPLYLDNVIQMLKALPKPKGEPRKKTRDINSALGLIQNPTKYSLPLGFENKLTVEKGRLTTNLFLTAHLKMTSENYEYLQSIRDIFVKKVNISGPPPIFQDFDSPLHISIATGYQKRAKLSDEALLEANEKISALDIGKTLCDITVDIDELCVQKGSHRDVLTLNLLDQ
ncbi:hypothetical protein KGF56_001148 [Candida oxycetoniae]|uniref:Uncharacterized protein n=1 Tax=Candida oxycetoniae TaxID=497107 RepID=A0AAI9SZP5_9ASCO|nr:uncharacterized protein KGF56_001148 [Candida oxycetoniae]KAI3405929.2 hypothetical protein KGF56_001148 [Candida oxycetoniae]